MNGYKEAAKLDDLINKLLKRHPPTRDNGRAWLAFTRTVMSGLKGCELEARKVLGLKEANCEQRTIPKYGRHA